MTRLNEECNSLFPYVRALKQRLPLHATLNFVVRRPQNLLRTPLTQHLIDQSMVHLLSIMVSLYQADRVRGDWPRVVLLRFDPV